MVETIAVLLVLGIVAAVIVSRSASTSDFQRVAEENTVKMHLRYAQYRAMSDDVSWGMAFNGGSYTIRRNGAAAPYNLPNESSPTRTMPSGYSVTGTTVDFDSWGSPGTTDISVTITGAGGSRSFVIRRNTGFIP